MRDSERVLARVSRTNPFGSSSRPIFTMWREATGLEGYKLKEFIDGFDRGSAFNQRCGFSTWRRLGSLRPGYPTNCRGGIGVPGKRR